jgi:hypothetical protein
MTRSATLLSCVLIVATLASGAAGGGAVGGCLYGTANATYFARAKAMARAAGVPVPLPSRVPAGANVAAFCVHPLPKSATDTTPEVGYPQFEFAKGKPPATDPTTSPGYTGAKYWKHGIAYGTFQTGLTMNKVLAEPQNKALRSSRQILRLGSYTVVHTAGYLAGFGDRCRSGTWFFLANGLIYLVNDPGTCSPNIPAGSAKRFIASLRAAY